MNKLICIDFDGTVVTHEYPEIGREVANAVKTLKRLIEYDCKLILWTMRSGEELRQAVSWFEDRDIKLWSVNDNPEQESWTDSRKVYAPIYIDDAALGCPMSKSFNGGRDHVDWYLIEKLLEGKGYFQREGIIGQITIVERANRKSVTVLN